MGQLNKRSLERLQNVKSVLIAILVDGAVDSPYEYQIPRYGGKRTDEEQELMYARGRTTDELRAKGIVGIEGKPERSKITWTLDSIHESGKAFDFFALINGKASWDIKYIEPIARHLQKIAKDKYGVILEWGYDLWKKDGAHMQMKK